MCAHYLQGTDLAGGLATPRAGLAAWQRAQGCPEQLQGWRPVLPLVTVPASVTSCCWKSTPFCWHVLIERFVLLVFNHC